jgi:hypothetical protein
MIRCGECKEPNEHSLDLETVKIEVSETDKIVDVTDEIKVEMHYPTYETVIINTDLDDKASMDLALNIVAGCISAVHTGDERVDCSNLDKAEVLEFLSSMTASQLKGVTKFVEGMPALMHDVAFKCKKCEADNVITLKGLSDFF